MPHARSISQPMASSSTSNASHSSSHQADRRPSIAIAGALAKVAAWAASAAVVAGTPRDRNGRRFMICGARPAVAGTSLK